MAHVWVQKIGLIPQMLVSLARLIQQMEMLVDRVEQYCQDLGEKEISAIICSFPGIRRTPLFTTNMNNPNTTDNPTHIAITALLIEMSMPIKLKWIIG